MAIKASRGSGSKLGRTETVSIRLDPRLNYLCELAARSQRRTKSSFIEATIAERLETLALTKWRDQDEPQTIGNRAETLWHVRESQRLVSLGIVAPHLMTFEEQNIWALIEENGYFWRGRFENGYWSYSIDLESIVRERVDQHWESLKAVSVGESKSSSLPEAPTSIIGTGGYELYEDIPF